MSIETGFSRGALCNKIANLTVLNEIKVEKVLRIYPVLYALTVEILEIKGVNSKGHFSGHVVFYRLNSCTYLML